jgi:hypothetical protein
MQARLVEMEYTRGLGPRAFGIESSNLSAGTQARLAQLAEASGSNPVQSGFESLVAYYKPL